MVLAVCFPAWLPAAEVQGLYESSTPVSSQSVSEREQALHSALSEVLVKVSGRSDVLLNPQLAAALKQPGRWLQQYRYQEEAPLKSGDPPQQVLWARFDTGGINELLRQHGESVWGRTRPATLLWAVIERNGQRELLQGGAPEYNLLATQARRRGLALVTPLMDLQDQRAITTSDVWGNFPDVIQQASTRYRTESILTGRLEQISGDEWRARWTLYDGGQSTDWNVQGTLPVVADLGMVGVMDLLSARYNRRGVDGAGGNVSLSIVGVDNLRNYARLTHYLQALEMVTDLRVVSVEPDRVTLNLQLRGDPAALAQTILLGNVIEPAETPPLVAGSSTTSGGGFGSSFEQLVPVWQYYRMLP